MLNRQQVKIQSRQQEKKQSRTLTNWQANNRSGEGLSMSGWWENEVQVGRCERNDLGWGEWGNNTQGPWGSGDVAEQGQRGRMSGDVHTWGRHGDAQHPACWYSSWIDQSISVTSKWISYFSYFFFQSGIKVFIHCDGPQHFPSLLKTLSILAPFCTVFLKTAKQLFAQSNTFSLPSHKPESCRCV